MDVPDKEPRKEAGYQVLGCTIYQIDSKITTDRKLTKIHLQKWTAADKEPRKEAGYQVLGCTMYNIQNR